MGSEGNTRKKWKFDYDAKPGQKIQLCLQDISNQTTNTEIFPNVFINFFNIDGQDQ